MIEETSINVNNTKTKIDYLGKHYSNKISTKEWHLYVIDLIDMNLNLNTTYQAAAAGITEKSITAKFVNKTIFNICNDVLSLVIYGKLNLSKKMESSLNVEEVNSTELIEDVTEQFVTNSSYNKFL